MVKNLLMLFLSAIAVNAQQPKVLDHTVVDGAKNPELIPDSLAAFHWFMAHSVVSPATDKQLEQQDALLQLGLTRPDKQVLLNILANFRLQYQSYEKQQHDSAAAGVPKKELFAKQREDLVASAVNQVSVMLSQAGAAIVKQSIQNQKRTIKMHHVVTQHPYRQ